MTQSNNKHEFDNEHETNFKKKSWRIGWLAFIFSLLFVVALYLIQKKLNFLGLDLTNEAVAAYLSIAPNFAVSFAGALVAIRIAQMASSAQDLSNELNDPLTIRADAVLSAVNRLHSARGLLKASYDITGRTAHAESGREVKFSDFHSICKSLNDTVKGAFLDTELISCCVSSRKTQEDKDEILGAVAQLLNQFAFWSEDDSYNGYEAKTFSFHYKTAEAHLEKVLAASEFSDRMAVIKLIRNN